VTEAIETPNEHKVKVLIGDPVALAKQRLMDFADSLGGGTDYDDNPYPDVTYTDLIERARAFQEEGEYWSEGGRFEGQGIYRGFWEDYALVTKKPVTDAYGFFSCSC
jgi:hypothetical protein